MLRSLKCELYKLFNRKELYIITTVLLLLSIASLIDVMFESAGKDASLMFTSFQAAMIFGNSRLGQSLIFFALPLICSITYGDAHAIERGHNMDIPLLIRSGRYQYYISKAIVIGLSSFVIIILPLIINQLFALLAFPSSNGTTHYYDNAYGDSLFIEVKRSLFPYLYMNYPVINNLLHILITGLYGCAMGILTYSISFFIISRLIVVLFTTILHLVITFFAISVLTPSFVFVNYFYSWPLPSAQMVPSIVIPCIAIGLPLIVGIYLTLRRASAKYDER